MRLVTYSAGGRTGVGLRRDGAIFDTDYGDMRALIADADAGLERAGAASKEVPDARVLAPIRPGKILCSGVNYASHADENPDVVMPEEPFFFAKLPSAVIGPDDPIRIPRPTTLADYEVELAMVIGTGGYRIPEERALEHVFGWTILHDVSARDVQFKDNQVTLGKNPDTFAPIGPEIVTSDELGDWSTLRVSSRLNGEVMQDSATAEMLFPPARLLAALTDLITLDPGDVVTTGSPAGVGCFRDPPVYMKPGDTVTVSVDRIGDLTNPVAAGW
jgi:2-keto-4-pentenoate hydratase/2-oxohepta-3-ene-1,7-dioic acid hydratase in catechol pathway